MLPLHRGGEWVSTQQTWSSSPLSRTRMLLTTALCCTQECGLTMLDQPTIQEMAGLVRWDTARTEHACGNGTGDGLSSSKVLQRFVALRFIRLCSLRFCRAIQHAPVFNMCPPPPPFPSFYDYHICSNLKNQHQQRWPSPRMRLWQVKRL